MAAWQHACTECHWTVHLNGDNGEFPAKYILPPKIKKIKRCNHWSKLNKAYMRFLCTILETSCELFQNTKLKKIPWQTKHPYSYHFGFSGKDAKSEKCTCCLVYLKHPTRYIGSEVWSKVARGRWPGFSSGLCAHPGWPGGVGSKGLATLPTSLPSPFYTTSTICSERPPAQPPSP